MYIFKSCPKCGGDLTIERNGVIGRPLSIETDFTCLQCGYYLQADERRVLLGRIVAYLRNRRQQVVTPTAA